MNLNASTECFTELSLSEADAVSGGECVYHCQLVSKGKCEVWTPVCQPDPLIQAFLDGFKKGAGIK